MRKLLQKMLFGGVGAAVLIACSAEGLNEEMSTLNASASVVEAPEITMNDLEGKWNMYSMKSVAFKDNEAVAVDFDQDESFTYDLLEETDCFDDMYFYFGPDGEVTTEQARLKFDGTSGKISCLKTGEYSATYAINGDQLEVTFKVNEVQFTETKTISLYTEGGIEYLKVTLTEIETDGAVYVTNDPGNTVASDIQQIEMIYKKEQKEQ